MIPLLVLLIVVGIWASFRALTTRIWVQETTMKKPNRVPRTVTAKDAVFTYLSICCTAPTEKPACAVDKGQIVGVYLGAKPAGEGSLGHFRCTQCRKSCKVTRHNKAVLATEEVTNG